LQIEIISQKQYNFKKRKRAARVYGFYTSNKYQNRKITVDGLSFDSMKEYNRYCELKMLQRAGVITELQMQVKFVLIPAQREPDTIGKRGGVKQGKLIEQECAYIADFVYKENGETVVEDTKGFKTKDYIIKRKLMLWLHGIRINEI
jgi:hypothetical protein